MVNLIVLHAPNRPAFIAGSLESNSIASHDLLAQRYIEEGSKFAIVMEDGEPVAIWSHADH